MTLVSGSCILSGPSLAHYSSASFSLTTLEFVGIQLLDVRIDLLGFLSGDLWEPARPEGSSTQFRTVLFRAVGDRTRSHSVPNPLAHRSSQDKAFPAQTFHAWFGGHPRVHHFRRLLPLLTGISRLLTGVSRLRPLGGSGMSLCWLLPDSFQSSLTTFIINVLLYC